MKSRPADVPGPVRYEDFGPGRDDVAAVPTCDEPTVRRLVSMVPIAAGDRMLIVGTGSGFSSALAAQYGARVVSVDRDVRLVKRAARLWSEAGLTSVEPVCADALTGVFAAQSFAAAVVWCGLAKLPVSLVSAVVEQGLLVVPVCPVPVSTQTLVVAATISDGVPCVTRVAPGSFSPAVTGTEAGERQGTVVFTEFGPVHVQAGPDVDVDALVDAICVAFRGSALGSLSQVGQWSATSAHRWRVWLAAGRHAVQVVARGCLFAGAASRGGAWLVCVECGDVLVLGDGGGRDGERARHAAQTCSGVFAGLRVTFHRDGRWWHPTLTDT